MIDTLQRSIRAQFDLDKILFKFSMDVDSHVVKKNSRPIYLNKGTGKSFIGKDKRVISAEKTMILEMRSQANKYKIEMIEEPCWAIFHFYFPKDHFFTKKGLINQKLPDLSNLYELPQDCLEDSGILKNDTLIHSHDLSRRLIGDKYKLEIFLLKFNEIGLV